MEKILVASDLSAQSEQLIACVDEFSVLDIKEVLLCHIFDMTVSGGESVSLKQYAEKKLAEMKAELEALGLRVTVVISSGFPAAEINELARREKVSLTVIAPHGAGYVKNRCLGSTAFEVIRTTDTPVLIEKCEMVAGNEEWQALCDYKLWRVMVPTDFSTCSYTALTMLKEIMDYVGRVLLVSVIEKCEGQEQLPVLQAEVQGKLDEIKAELVAAGMAVDTRVAVGPASENILDIAEKEEVTLILLPKVGAGLVKGLLLGTTAQEVALRSAQPVLIIPCVK